MRILIADDDPVSRCLLEELLTEWGHEVVACGDGAEAWAVLQGSAPPLLAILDWVMPSLDGLELCRRIRRQPATSYVYVILLTSRTGKENLLAGMEAGADEYLSKPYDPQELRLRIRAGQRIVELERALRLQATHDPLTGAWNRGAVLEILQRDLSRAQREGLTITAIMVDVDHFKHINDTWGHQIGDVVLREVVMRLAQSLRPYDALGRYGGEEFLIVVLNVPVTSVVHLAERLRTCTADLPVQTSVGKVAVTISLGVATEESAGDVDATELLRRADEALYEAKKQGRNRLFVTPREVIAAARPELQQMPTPT